MKRKFAPFLATLFVGLALMITTGSAQADPKVQSLDNSEVCDCCQGDETKRWSGNYIGERSVAKCEALNDGACRGTDLASFMCDAYRGAKCCLRTHGGLANGTINAKGFCQAKDGTESANFTRPPC